MTPGLKAQPVRRGQRATLGTKAQSARKDPRAIPALMDLRGHKAFPVRKGQQAQTVPICRLSLTEK